MKSKTYRVTSMAKEVFSIHEERPSRASALAFASRSAVRTVSMTVT